MKKIIALITAVISTTAMAAVPLPMGWYLEGNVGSSHVSNADYAPNSSVSGSGLAGNIDIGYKFIPFFAAEIGYTYYASTSAKVNDVKVATATEYSYDVAGKGILPFGNMGFELFAKLGVAGVSSHVKEEDSAGAYPVNTGTHTSTGVYYALGADYVLMPNVSVNLQWARAAGDNTTGNLDLYSVGVNYLFDSM